jgi:hypothetical protein
MFQTRPTIEEFKMRIVDITSHLGYRGLVIEKWPNVVATMKLVLKGLNPKAKISQHDVKFLEDELECAYQFLQCDSQWRLTWTDDCPGALFRLSVWITVQDRQKEIYTLELNEQYSGNRLEIGLCQLDKKYRRAVAYGQVELECLPYNISTFKSDFELVLPPLRTALNDFTMSSSEYVQLLDETSRTSGQNLPIVPVFQDASMTVLVEPVGVEARFSVNSGDTDYQDSWHFDGPVLICPIKTSHNSNPKRRPGIQIRIVPTPETPDEILGPRLFTSTLEWARVITLTSQIARAFRQQAYDEWQRERLQEKRSR